MPIGCNINEYDIEDTYDDSSISPAVNREWLEDSGEDDSNIGPFGNREWLEEDDAR